MNRKKYDEALDWLYSLAVPCREEVHEHRSSFLGEKYNLIKNLIDERFDNQPLKWDELKEGMWVWDNEEKKYNKIISLSNDLTIEFYYIADDCTKYKVKFKEIRFYRKQVEEC